MTQVSVIIPTLNEAANLAQVVQEVSAAMASANLTYEIIVVDDASTDGTSDVARELGTRWPVRLIERRAERGLSTAVVAGMRQATGDVFAVLDADGSHPGHQVAELARCVLRKEADIAIGSRYAPGGSVAEEWAWTRHLTSRLASIAARLLAKDISDPMAGMFVVSRRVFGQIDGRIRPCGFKILLEILSAVENARAIEFPISFRERKAGQSKLTAGVMKDYLRQLLRLYVRKIFVLLSCPLRKPNPRAEKVRPAARFHASERTRAVSSGRTSGFTLVELLTIVAIITLLMSLLLPTVQAAREAARRTTCASKLRNLAIAVQNYHDAHNGYPRSRFKVPHDVGPSGRAWSWIARILPFIEEQALYDELSVSRATLGEKTHLIARPLGFLLCPSSGGPPSRLGSGNFEDDIMGVTNYKAVCGANWGADETQNLDDIGSRWRHVGFNGSFDGQAHGDGIMWRDDYRIRMRSAKVTDGLSHTYMLGEDVPRYNLWNSWAFNTHAFGTCAIPPNVKDADPRWWPDSMGFRSAHPSGLHFAHADGSVVLISSGIAISAYRQSASRRDARQW